LNDRDNQSLNLRPLLGFTELHQQRYGDTRARLQVQNIAEHIFVTKTGKHVERMHKNSLLIYFMVQDMI